MISGWPLAAILAALSVWLVLLGVALRSTQKRTPTAQPQRKYFTLAALICCMIAVGSLFCLHLSWVNPAVSQKLGTTAISLFGQLIFWPTLAGLFLSAAGLGFGRVIGILTCLGTGFWYFTLAIASAISLGTVTARHPTRYLIPAGYVGWITIHFGEKGKPPLQIVDDIYICRIPKSGVLATSSKSEDGWAKDEYFYYSDPDHLDRLAETAWGAGGRVWGEEISADPGKPGSAAVTERIYIGTEDQFRRNETHSAS